MVFVDEPLFRRVRNSVFPDLGLGSAHFWLNMAQSLGFLDGFDWVLYCGFGARIWVLVCSKFDLSSLKQFEVRYIWVRSNT